MHVPCSRREATVLDWVYVIHTVYCAWLVEFWSHNSCVLERLCVLISYGCYNNICRGICLDQYAHSVHITPTCTTRSNRVKVRTRHWCTKHRPLCSTCAGHLNTCMAGRIITSTKHPMQLSAPAKTTHAYKRKHLNLAHDKTDAHAHAYTAGHHTNTLNSRCHTRTYESVQEWSDSELLLL